jgi:hypothetical protein
MRTNLGRIILIAALVAAWIIVHYQFDKKDADGLGIYVVLILGSIGLWIENYFRKRSQKEK